jgi:two-component system response regulator NreC
MLKILLAEDHNIVRNGIKMLLETDNSIQIVGEALNGLQVLEKIDQSQDVDIVLTDINMPEMDGISMIKHVKETNPNIQVVILSMHDNEKYVMEAFAEGAAGYLLKNVAAEELIYALKSIHNGGRYLCAELTMKLIDDLITNRQYPSVKNKLTVDFSSREIEVLNHIAEGLTNTEMAEKLFISKRTVEGHRQSLIDKTGSKNTAALISFAFSNGLIN